MVFQTGVLACIFILLCMAHFVADFLFQTQYQAMNKHSSWKVLLWHSMIYTLILCLTIALAVGWLAPPERGLNLSPGYLKQILPYDLAIVVVIFVSHALIDTYRLTYWWRKYVGGCKWEDINEFKLSFTTTRDFVVNVTVDQIWHILIVGLISWILYSVRFGSVWVLPG